MEIVLFTGVRFDWRGNLNEYSLNKEQSKKLKYYMRSCNPTNKEYIDFIKKLISEDPDYKYFFHIATIPDEATDYYIFTEMEGLDDNNFLYDYNDKLVYVINGKIHEYKKENK